MRPTEELRGRRPARVAGIGELLWDLLPRGPRLGGAPFNVVAHLRRLGFEAAYLTAVGSDELGTRALAETARLGVSTDLVQRVGERTGTARVRIDVAGTPGFEIVSPAAYEYFALEDPADRVGSLDALVFGTLAQRFEGIHRATRALAPASALRLYDVNLREGCWDARLVDELARLATVVKLNEEEASVLAAELSLPAAPLYAFASAMADRYRLQGVCVTRGPDGAALLLNGRYREVPAPPVVVVDTVGAGDAFAAGLVAGILQGRSLDELLELAARLAALVASREGAIPDWDPAEVGLAGAREP